MAQNLSAVFSITDKYTTSITKIIQSQEKFEKKQMQIDKLTQTFNNKMGGLKQSTTIGASGVDSLVGRMASLVSTAYLVKKAFDITFQSVKTSAFQKIQETTFQALLNSKEAGSNLYKYVGAYAKISALGREDIAKGVTSFLTVTRDMNQVEQLIKMTERLYAKDPTQGAEGAVFALKEALAGDTISLRNRYGITGLSGEKLRKSDTTGKIEQIDTVLNAFGATQEVVDANYGNLITQTNIFTSNLKTAIGENATPIMNNLAQVAARLNENMEAGKYQPFINLMVNGMSAIGNGIAFVADNANWLIPVVGGVVTAIVAYNTATAVAGVVTKSLRGDWIGIAAMAVGVTAAIGMMSLAMKDVNASVSGATTDVDKLKSAAGKTLAGTKLPVEITNTDPVKVTGEVDIEKENLKYLLDIAGAKFFAKYSTATLAPQLLIQNMNVTKETDTDTVVNNLTEGLAQASAANAQGVYSFA